MFGQSEFNEPLLLRAQPIVTINPVTIQLQDPFNDLMPLLRCESRKFVKDF
ncbi:MAG TPA: hypothetical protein VGM54_19560 [Chthoniobacter sp.]|jgi:hypothetical protein